jgi:hypothetical protein
MNVPEVMLIYVMKKKNLGSENHRTLPRFAFAEIITQKHE